MKRAETPPEGTIHYEHRDVGERPMLVFAIAFVVSLAVIVAALSGLALGVWGLRHEPTVQPWPEPAASGPPRLQPSPSADLARFQAEKRRRLESYGWVDRDAGIVHIPIERAIEIEAARAALAGAR